MVKILMKPRTPTRRKKRKIGMILYGTIFPTAYQRELLQLIRKKLWENVTFKIKHGFLLALTEMERKDENIYIHAFFFLQNNGEFFSK